MRCVLAASLAALAAVGEVYQSAKGSLNGMRMCLSVITSAGGGLGLESAVRSFEYKQNEYKGLERAVGCSHSPFGGGGGV